MPGTVQNGVCASTSPHSLHRCDCRSQCGTRPLPRSVSGSSCALRHTYGAVQDYLLKADSFRGAICVVALTVLPISVLFGRFMRVL